MTVTSDPRRPAGLYITHQPHKKYKQKARGLTQAVLCRPKPNASAESLFPSEDPHKCLGVTSASGPPECETRRDQESFHFVLC
jgi:hypothetical protein